MKTKKQLRREATQIYRLCLNDGTLDEGRVRQAVHQIINEKRRGYFALLAYFRRLVKLDHDRHTAEVESAVPLSPDLQTEVQTGLERASGPRLSILFAHRPKLFGGMRIKVGSDVYDSSVRSKLFGRCLRDGHAERSDSFCRSPVGSRFLAVLGMTVSNLREIQRAIGRLG